MIDTLVGLLCLAIALGLGVAAWRFDRQTQRRFTREPISGGLIGGRLHARLNGSTRSARMFLVTRAAFFPIAAGAADRRVPRRVGE